MIVVVVYLPARRTIIYNNTFSHLYIRITPREFVALAIFTTQEEEEGGASLLSDNLKHYIHGLSLFLDNPQMSPWTNSMSTSGRPSAL